MIFDEVVRKVRSTPTIRYIESIVNKMIDADYPGMAAEMAFMFILGLFPFLLFAMSVYAWLGRSSLSGYVISALTQVAPSDVSRLIESTLSQVTVFKHGGIMAVICFFVTIALSSNAVASVMKGLNRAFQTDETRPFIYTRILSVLMVFLNVIVLFLTVNMILLGKIIMSVALELFHIPNLTYQIIMILRWPLSFLVLYFTSYFSYYILPDIKGNEWVKRKAALVGTLFFSCFWLLGSWSFSLYLDHLNTYNRVFGTIGAFVIMMVWLYYTAMIILLGGEFNYRTYLRLTEREEKKHQRHYDEELYEE